jgi:monomeric isocitrate dehydrogenase
VDVSTLVDAMTMANRRLWDAEDRFHAGYQAAIPDEAFAAAARQIIELNAERSSLKRQISVLCQSGLIEEKAYGARAT